MIQGIFLNEGILESLEQKAKPKAFYAGAFRALGF